jgi:4a-hydroxytetrahydrobiopterin dehydratase
MGRSKGTADETYTDEEVAARLQDELPCWYLDGGWICRKYKTSGWKATLMVVNAVGHLAEAAFHHPDLSVSYACVTVKLQNHAAKGITDKDFALALRIEDVIQWQPGKEGGPLQGTPDDPRFAYIEYDSGSSSEH